MFPSKYIFILFSLKLKNKSLQRLEILFSCSFLSEATWWKEAELQPEEAS